MNIRQGGFVKVDTPQMVDRNNAVLAGTILQVSSIRDKVAILIHPMYHTYEMSVPLSTLSPTDTLKPKPAYKIVGLYTLFPMHGETYTSPESVFEVIKPLTRDMKRTGPTTWGYGIRAIRIIKTQYYDILTAASFSNGKKTIYFSGKNPGIDMQWRVSLSDTLCHLSRKEAFYERLVSDLRWRNYRMLKSKRG